jgi:methionyl-tRNA formyltransferase
MSTPPSVRESGYTLFGAGLKAALVLEALSEDLQPDTVYAYEVSGEDPTTFKRLREATQGELHVLPRGEVPPVPRTGLAFTIGWQFRLKEFDSLVVLHDSLLPKFRGFSPTVSSLILGETKIGVTAIRPIAELDAGPIVAQHSVSITHPIKVQHAFELLAPCYVNCIRESIRKFGQPAFAGTPQLEQQASYSVWRDSFDLEIDWRTSADQVARFVAAVGYPYAGAYTTYGEERIIIDEVEVIADLPFVNRVAGKIWQRNSENVVEVLCGNGMIRITSARREDGSHFSFPQIRKRFGRGS